MIRGQLTASVREEIGRVVKRKTGSVCEWPGHKGRATYRSSMLYDVSQVGNEWEVFVPAMIIMFDF